MKFLEYLKDHIVCLDGGMGTLLQAAGMKAGELPERQNLTHPDRIRDIHLAYYRAGANVVSTNTFGANGLKFSSEELQSIVKSAVLLASEAREAAKGEALFVALDVGPLGKLLKPLGELDFEDAVSLFGEVMVLGEAYGADLIFIETMSDSLEAKAALLAAKEKTSLPVMVSLAFGADETLMTGATPEAMVALLEGMGADAIGANCSLGPKQLASVARRFLAASSLPVLLKPNAGLPHEEEGRAVYDVRDEEFAEEMAPLLKEGLRLAGGCCGTTPETIVALKKKIETIPPSPLVKKERATVSSYTHACYLDREPVLIGERINPTGKKRLKEALKSGDMAYLAAEGVRQQEKGAMILDVNVGLPEIDEKALLCQAVGVLQEVVDLPLQIDTADPEAMEAALRRYNGKALINSVNGKKESMDAVFPLVKKYGGVVIALTLDENGIPKSAEERIAIAERILAQGARYGLGKRDLVFDPLAMTVSTDPMAARETLRAVKLLHEMGCLTSLGVSNISFGLPRRDKINSTFFALALENGLSCAIMNPDSQEMMDSYFAYCALTNQDRNFEKWIAHAEDAPVAVEAKAASTPVDALTRAVEKGLRAEAKSAAEESLKATPPLTLVNEAIIPALNRVGEGFEKNTVFLPQLLMSAEAAAAAFEVIKGAMPKKETEFCRPILLATVEGDIHDIGKNIVRLLLENFGFAVVDLGKNTPPQRILDEVIRQKAPLVGLSALMTTTVPSMEKTIRLIREKAPDCKVMVGGAVLTEEYAAKIGADFYAKDAMEGVRFAERLLRS